MSEKVFLILVDGMRIDAPDACGNDYVVQFKTKAKLLAERTVMPSVTLPCHMSLFHSVTPQRHGILTNTYVPQVHTVEGLVERLKAAGKNQRILLQLAASARPVPAGQPFIRPVL